MYGLQTLEDTVLVEGYDSDSAEASCGSLVIKKPQVDKPQETVPKPEGRLKVEA